MKEPEKSYRLNELLAAAGQRELDPPLAEQFATYLALLTRWNTRLNLTAIRDEEAILSRHFVESLICARTIPSMCTTLLDYGSGAGFPGIPIALCRPSMSVTLAESQAKKAAFLREAVRTLALTATVYNGRAEALNQPFDCVAMRAVDRMEKAVALGSRLVSPQGWLVLMTTGKEFPALQAAARPEFNWAPPLTLPHTEDRLIALGSRAPLSVPRGTNSTPA